jgi:hypothetical protein
VANSVKLTFAGDEAPLKRSFDEVGRASEVMAVRVTDATNEAGERFDHLSSQSSLLSGGIGDVGGALTEAFGENNPIGAFGAQMEKASAIIMGFTGLADLAVFATNNLKLATIGKTIADKAATATQWLMNSALLASPLTWVVVGIAAVIAAVVLIEKKTGFFSRSWRAAWGWVKTAASNAWDFVKKIPGWTGTAFAKVAGYITKPYRAAFNLVADAWNNTIGRLSWTVPSWIPGIGGNSISVPNLPHFHAGGTVPGIPGTPTPVLALAGEKVSSMASGSGGDGGWVTVRGDALIDTLTRMIADRVDSRGGRPAQLGIRIA